MDKKESSSEIEYKEALRELKSGLGFSPLTGEIVVIGVLDCGKNQGVVYFQAPGEDIKEFSKDNITFKQATEKEMLEKFLARSERIRRIYRIQQQGIRRSVYYDAVGDSRRKTD